MQMGGAGFMMCDRESVGCSRLEESMMTRDFSYFLQTGECAKKNLAKIKVKKWTCLRCPEKNREFVTAWHALIRTAGQKMVEHKQSGRGEKLQELAMYILNEFYVADLPEAAYDDTGITTIYESLCNKIENARESLAHF